MSSDDKELFLVEGGGHAFLMKMLGKVTRKIVSWVDERANNRSNQT